MSVSLEYLQRCSLQTGYQVPPLEKIVRLGDMAGDVAPSSAGPSSGP